jgi:hypothetical protein
MTAQLNLFDTLAEIIRPVTAKYHNTTGLTGEQLTREYIRTGTQNDKVLQWLMRHPGEWSPSQVWVLTNMKAEGVPLTSIRRAITDLTPDYLEKTGTMKIGIYGKPEGCWRVKK